MCSIILTCRRFRLNPGVYARNWLNKNYLWTSLDNISTPLASCLGDLLTLTLLSFLATFLTLPRISLFQLPLLFTLFFIFVLGLAIFASLRNTISRPLLKDGLSWVPLLCAMAISSGTGLVLDEFVTKWKDFGSLAIVVSGQPHSTYDQHPVSLLISVYPPGLPGGIGAIFISRLSTDLHARGHNSKSGEGSERPFATGTILFSVGLPVLFTYLIFMYAVGWIELPILFLAIFVLAFCVSVSPIQFPTCNRFAERFTMPYGSHSL